MGTSVPYNDIFPIYVLWPKYLYVFFVMIFFFTYLQLGNDQTGRMYGQLTNVPSSIVPMNIRDSQTVIIWR